MDPKAQILTMEGIDPTTNELFVSKARFGSAQYFREAMAAGFYGVNDRQTIAFRTKAVAA